MRLGWSDGELPWSDDIVCAGHSLGELAALVAAGALDPLEGLRLVAARGRAMQRAAELRPGGMMALAAAPIEAERIAARIGAAVANDNAPRQIVLSGSPESLEEGMREAKRSGLRAVVLPVPAALHSPTMEPAVIEFSAALATAEVQTPRWPVYSCASARPFEDVRRELAEALVRGVRWRETVHALHRAGARRFVEVGPGRVLTGLVRRTLRDVEAVTSSAPVTVVARG